MRFLIAMTVLVPALAWGAPTRIKELADVQGVRENELFGYGLVVGLAGTGDTERVFFTSQTIAGMLGRLGIRIDPNEVRVRNVAAVMVTARLPPYVRPGSRIDVAVASMGNARSLAGGVLLITPLSGGDGLVHAVAQGPVQAGGYEATSAGSLLQKNQPTSGRIPQGALIERAVIPKLEGPLLLGLKRPDFTTATRIATAINAELGGDKVAKALDPAAVEVKLPEEYKDDAVSLVARLEVLEVEADRRAKVVVSERTGTVVAGQGVRLRPVAVAHGGLHVSIGSAPVISQPGPFSGGQTAIQRQSQVEASEGSRSAVALPATASVDELVKALNLLGASPRDLVAILQAIQTAGALDGELEVL
ncbi:MAG: flagellar basal body P-ring protein FlgI [Deltaproteobacteria bacterium]|nr:flagellar basal body P-ring protein FlgI [Deltaproteobacteria bacterium]